MIYLESKNKSYVNKKIKPWVMIRDFYLSFSLSIWSQNPLLISDYNRHLRSKPILLEPNWSRYSKNSAIFSLRFYDHSTPFSEKTENPLPALDFNLTFKCPPTFLRSVFETQLLLPSLSFYSVHMLFFTKTCKKFPMPAIDPQAPFGSLPVWILASQLS